MKRKHIFTILLSLSLCAFLLLAGCRATADPETDPTDAAPAAQTTDAAETTETAAASGPLQAAEIFTARDLRQEADLSGAKELAVSDGETIEITEAGVYAVSGSAENCTIRIDAADDAKVQLVLCGVTVTNGAAPVVYLANADKLFITTAQDRTIWYSTAPAR